MRIAMAPSARRARRWTEVLALVVSLSASIEHEDYAAGTVLLKDVKVS
jgi:hypothetical protein